MFFGREKTLGIRVVLKQYVGLQRKAIMSEIKIFTLLESLRKNAAGSELVNALNKNKMLTGLPLMLGYRIGKEQSEIMMTHGGCTISQWVASMETRHSKADFAAEFLRQGIKALKTIHGVGYSHGDIKPDNICVKETKDGQL